MHGGEKDSRKSTGEYVSTRVLTVPTEPGRSSHISPFCFTDSKETSRNRRVINGSTWAATVRAPFQAYRLQLHVRRRQARRQTHRRQARRQLFRLQQSPPWPEEWWKMIMNYL